MFVWGDGFVEGGVEPDDVAHLFDFVVEPVIFGSGDVAVDGLEKGLVLRFFPVENCTTVGNHFLTARLRNPVLVFEVDGLGLVALLHAD